MKHCITWPEYLVWQHRGPDDYFLEVVVDFNAPQETDYSAIKNCLKLPPMNLDVPLITAGSRENGLKANILATFNGINRQENKIYIFDIAEDFLKTETQTFIEKVTYHTLIYKSLFDQFPKISLVRHSTEYGTTKIFPMRISLEECELLKDRLNKMYDSILARGWWSRQNNAKTILVKQAEEASEQYLLGTYE